jgi:hypothetical protein
MANDVRNAHVYQRAHALAASGLYHCPNVIVATLVADGYPEAIDLLNTDNIRADLLRVCEAASPSKPRTDLWRFRPLANARP